MNSDSPRQWPAITMVIAGLLFFGAVAADVLFHGQLWRWDRPMQAWIHRNAWWPVVLGCSAISGLGDFFVIVGITLPVGAILWRRGCLRTLAVMIVALVGSALLNLALKHTFRIPRPAEFTYYVFKPNSGYTFPSGHTMAAAVTAGTLALVWMHHVRMEAARRWLVGFCVAAVAVLEAGSLMYIGVHYLTDVLAAMGVSLAWLGVVRVMLPVKREPTNSEFRVQSSE